MSGLFQREISRRTALGAAVLTFVVSVVAGQEFGATPGEPQSTGTRTAQQAGATARAPAGESRKDPAAELDLAALHRPRRAGASRDPFAADPWAAAATPKIAPADPTPPPPQSAPALSGTFLGRMVDGTRQVVFLDRHQEVLTIRAGDVIDGIYRVEAITPSEVRLLHLPSGAKQSIALPPLQ
jgi:hypothetical protein